MATIESVEHKHEEAHEHHGIGRYALVLAILLALTGITVWSGKQDFGGYWNIVIAMFIACTKATLVVLFFMHLWDEGGVNRLIFVTSVVFVGVLMLFTFGDLMFRVRMALPHGGPPLG